MMETIRMLDLPNSIFSSRRTEQTPELAKYVLNNFETIRCSWHPLGFVIFKLGHFNQYQYRLHIWPYRNRRTKNPDWPIHNHIFNLESLVLRGTVGSKCVLVCENSLEHSTHQLYRVEYTENGSDIISTGKSVSLVEQKICWTECGVVYDIPKGEYHQSYVGMDEYAATLVRTTGVSSGDVPMVVGKIDGAARYVCPSLRLNKIEAAKLLAPLCK